MKKKLLPKLIGGYFLFGLLGFLLLTTFTYHVTYNYLEKKEASGLYRESALVASNYAQNYFTSSTTLNEIKNQLQSLDTYLNADIWIVDTKGTVLLNTGSTSTESVTISNFDMTDFGNKYSPTSFSSKCGN